MTDDLPHIAPEWREQWRKDCLHWRGRVLTGAGSHWCDEWDGLPIDESTPEWPCGCGCATVVATSHARREGLV